MEARVIIISAQKSNKSKNTVWAVAVTGDHYPKAYCKSAYKAMRFAYLLKKRTGLNISENCLARLSQEIKAAAGKPAQEQQKAEEPKKKARKPRTKKAQVVALQ